ncbi:MAG: anaerobic ribonucleoside-triphosphate reductase activating protein [Candidatus Diapherotrites archaeon]
MVSVKGLQKTSLIDYPDNVCATVFLGGCNFRCPYCYNTQLVLEPEKLPSMSEGQLLDFLEGRKKLLDGVCITGGEPTMQKDLPELIERIKKIGLKVKLDTNGSNPRMLRELIEEKLLDFIAMDIKAPLEKYGKVTCVKIDSEKIRQSAELVKKSGIDYEFRSTVLPELFLKEDALKIGEWLNGAKVFYLQQFRPMQGTLDPSYAKKKPYTREELDELRKAMEPFFRKVEIRNA